MSVRASSLDDLDLSDDCSVQDAGASSDTGQGQQDGQTRRSASMQAVAKGETERGRMNQTESRWARLLDAHGDVLDWWYVSYRVRYGDSGYHTPDFLVLRMDGSVEVHEVKAHCTDAGRTRFKAAANEHWLFRWIMVVQKGKRQPWTVKYDTSDQDGSLFINDTNS